MNTDLLTQLLQTEDPATRAALTAEAIIAQFPPIAQDVVRCCALFHWFNNAIIAALLDGFQAGANGHEGKTTGVISASELYTQLAELSFTEHVAWGLTYHDLTRAGLLTKYAAENANLLQQGARLAMSVYLADADDLVVAAEGFYCAVVANETARARELLDQLLNEAGERQNWNYFAGLFQLIEDTKTLPFVEPLTFSSRHWLARGIARRDQGDLDAAIHDYTEAIRLNPNYAAAYNNRGNAFSAQGNLDTAIDDYTTAIGANSKYAIAYYNRGNTFSTQGNLDAAVHDYNEAIRLNPDDAAAYYNRGNTFSAQGDLDAAVRDYTEAIHLNPDDAIPYYNRGLTRQEQGYLDAAIYDYTEAIRLSPHDAATYYNRGLVQQAQGDLDAAFHDYTEAIRLNPDSAAAYYNRGLIQQVQGDLYAAIHDYTEAIRLFPDGQDKAAVYNNQGLVRRILGDLVNAIHDYTEAIHLNPEDAAAYYNRGGVYRLLGQWQPARADYLRVVTLDPNRWIAWIGIADAARHLGNEELWRQAISQAQPLVEYDDFYNAACFESVAGNVDRALELLEAAAQVGKFDPDWALKDADLHWIRDDERFQKLLAQTMKQQEENDENHHP